LDGLAFGLGAAVLEFNRVPAHVVALARRYLAIPIVNLYDDFRITDIACSGGSANAAFLDLIAWIGWWLDQGKEQTPRPAITFLGAIEDASFAAAADVVRLGTTEKRRTSLLATIQAMIAGRRATPGDAASVVGKLIHVGGTMPGKLGRATLAGLSAHSRGSATELSDDALRVLRFYEFLLSGPVYKEVPLAADRAEAIAVISDASWKDLPVPGLLGRVCFIIYDEASDRRVGGVLDVLSESTILRDLRQRWSQIMPFEILGPILALTLGRFRLARRAANFFVDNMSGLCSLARGTSKREDLSAMCFGFHTAAVFCMVKPWLDYVPSASNLADGGSRVGVSDAEAADAGVKLVQIPAFWLPSAFEEAGPRDWIAWWQETEALAVDFERALAARVVPR